MKQTTQLANAASRLDPRNGAPKVTAIAQPVPRMVRQTPDSVFTGPGQSSLDDEPNLPIKSHTKPVPLHPSTPARIAAKVHPVANDPGAVLRAAANLGRKA
jgi:hypothetical protein